VAHMMGLTSIADQPSADVRVEDGEEWKCAVLGALIALLAAACGECAGSIAPLPEIHAPRLSGPSTGEPPP
jgi:hypothetical protein